MLKKVLVASCLLVASMASQATMISHFGYDRDSASNIVKGGGKEWLKWDVTKGLSIDQALAAYGAEGWTLASNRQMASLFNVFQFGKTDWSDVEDVFQITLFGGKDDGTDDSVYLAFVDLFGATVSWDYYRRATYALFGSDSDDDELFQESYINIDYDRIIAGISDDKLSRDWAWEAVGVALVRPQASVEPSPVSLPGSLSLLTLGLVGLGFRRRQALRF